MDEKKIAILIDGDNISQKYATLIKEEADKYGDITLFKLYGSISSPTVKQWMAIMPKYGISPALQLSYANNKSIADQALTIDAMDILYRNIVDIFFLVTSDSDFTKLVYRLKESGKIIIGMGESKTPEALAQACNEFKVLDVLFKAGAAKTKVPEIPTPVVDDAVTPIPVEDKIIEIPTEAAIVEKIASVLEDDWENLANVGDVIRKSVPGFDVRNYKYVSFSAFVKAHKDVFDVDEKLGPDNIHKVVNIRNRQDKKKNVKNLQLPVEQSKSETSSKKQSEQSGKQSGKGNKSRSKQGQKSKNKQGHKKQA
ncbi:MAG: NYN domain-containing protein [Lachnospiraceae bacterium]|nr:NYN domain-containing protein [Lachnospiraceae bacterium]